MSFNAGSPQYSQQAGAQPNVNIPGYRARQLPNMSPQQNQLFQQLLSAFGPGATQAGEYFSKLGAGDESTFEAQEQPIYNAYNKFLGSTANRFSHLGARNSSSFQNAAVSGAQDLSQLIGANRADTQQRALQLLLNQSNSLLTQKPFENVLVQKSQGNGGLFGQALGIIPSLLKAFGGG